MLANLVFVTLMDVDLPFTHLQTDEPVHMILGLFLVVVVGGVLLSRVCALPTESVQTCLMYQLSPISFIFLFLLEVELLNEYLLVQKVQVQIQAQPLCNDPGRRSGIKHTG